MNRKTRFGFVIEYVKNIETAERFYVDVVGLAVERRAPQFVQFEHFAIASDEAMGPDRQRELYWLIEDADAAQADLAKKSEITMPLKKMPFGKVFGIKGPAGEPCYVLELAAHRPSAVV